MRIVRQFCDPDAAPYNDIAVRRTGTTRDAGGPDDGPTAFTAPADWPLSSAQAVAALGGDRFGAAAPVGRTSADLPTFLRTDCSARDAHGTTAVLGVLDRLAARWSRWGWRLGFFDQDEDARAFFDEVRWLLAYRAMAPDAVAWAGLAGAPPLRGFGIDPFTGRMAPAHALNDFAPLAPATTDGDAPLDNVVRLIRDTVESSGEEPGIPAPVMTLDLMRFIGHSGALDAAALAHATRLCALIAEIELATRLYRTEALARSAYANRPLAIGPANLGAFLLAQGLGHDSEAANAMAQATVGLITAAVTAASAEIAAEAGPCPAFATAKRPLAKALNAQRAAMERALARIGAVARPAHLSGTAKAIAERAAGLWSEAVAGAAHGLRNTRFTALQTGHEHRPLPIAVQSPGAKALPHLMCEQELGDGRITPMVAPPVVAGLGMLGYDVAVQAAAIRHLRGRRTLDGAPGVSLEALCAKGIDDAALARIEDAVAETGHIRYAINRWVLGAELCDDVLGLDPVASRDYAFDLLAALGFAPEAIEAANRYCVGADSLAGTAGLADSDARALALPTTEAAARQGEARMAKAVSAVLSLPAVPPDSDAPPARSTSREAASAAPARALATVERS